MDHVGMDLGKKECQIAIIAEAGELDHQFAALEYDIRQRAVLSKATGERA